MHFNYDMNSLKESGLLKNDCYYLRIALVTTREAKDFSAIIVTKEYYDSGTQTSKTIAFGYEPNAFGGSPAAYAKAKQ